MSNSKGQGKYELLALNNNPSDKEELKESTDKTIRAIGEGPIRICTINGEDIEYDACSSNANEYKGKGWTYLGKGFIKSLNGTPQGLEDEEKHFWVSRSLRKGPREAIKKTPLLVPEETLLSWGDEVLILDSMTKLPFGDNE